MIPLLFLAAWSLADCTMREPPMPRDLEARFRRSIKLLDRKHVVEHSRLTITRVEDWTPRRCLHGTAMLHYVFDLIDTKTNLLDARASTDALGTAEVFAPAMWKYQLPGRIMPIGEAMARLAHAHIAARDPQYIAVWGTLRCDELVPCVAARGGGDVYIVQEREIYVLTPRRFDGRKALPTSLPKDERLMSLGGYEWAAVRRVTSAP